MAKLFANSGDPDQMPHSVASDLGLHCLPMWHLIWVCTVCQILFFGVFRPKWINVKSQLTLYKHQAKFVAEDILKFLFFLFYFILFFFF